MPRTNNSEVHSAQFIGGSASRTEFVASRDNQLNNTPWVSFAFSLLTRPRQAPPIFWDQLPANEPFPQLCILEKPKLRHMTMRLMVIGLCVDGGCWNDRGQKTGVQFMYECYMYVLIPFYCTD